LSILDFSKQFLIDDWVIE